MDPQVSSQAKLGRRTAVDDQPGGRHPFGGTRAPVAQGLAMRDHVALDPLAGMVLALSDSLT